MKLLSLVVAAWFLPLEAITINVLLGVLNWVFQPRLGFMLFEGLFQKLISVVLGTLVMMVVVTWEVDAVRPMLDALVRDGFIRPHVAPWGAATFGGRMGGLFEAVRCANSLVSSLTVANAFLGRGAGGTQSGCF